MLSLGGKPEYALIAVCTGVALAALRYGRAKSRPPLPPGPKGWPFIGNALQIPQVEPWKVYKEWSKEHGDLIYLEAMGQPILVLNSKEAIQELFVKRATNYSDRVLSVISDLTGIDWSLVFMHYTKKWRDYRKTFHRFFSEDALRKCHPIIEQETTDFLRSLLDTPEAFNSHLGFLFGCILMRMSYGFEDTAYNKEAIQRVENFLHGFGDCLVPGRFLVVSFPIMRFIPSWFPGAGWKRYLNHLKELGDEGVNRPFVDVEARIKAGKVPGRYPSVAGTLLPSLTETDQDYQYQRRMALGVSGIAYTAGTETTHSTATSGMFILATRPDIVQRLQAEVDVVTGGTKLPTCLDIAQISYLQAFIKELLRWHVTAPLGLPHAAKNDDVYRGYHIPAGTFVIPNSWAVLHDPEIYRDPEGFKPERFLTDDGALDPSVPDPEFGAFGYGRRICPGRFVANDTLAMAFASLVSVFDVAPPLGDDGKPVDLKFETAYRALVAPLPFKCRITPRSSAHEALLRA